VLLTTKAYITQGLHSRTILVSSTYLLLVPLAEYSTSRWDFYTSTSKCIHSLCAPCQLHLKGWAWVFLHLPLQSDLWYSSHTY